MSLLTNFSSRLGFFLESGYAYRVVTNVSGDGFEYMDNIGDFWEGEWGIVSINSMTPWGQMVYELPNNMWDRREFTKIRNFKLDLSGFQIRVGIFFRF